MKNTKIEARRNMEGRALNKYLLTILNLVDASVDADGGRNSRIGEDGRQAVRDRRHVADRRSPDNFVVASMI